MPSFTELETAVQKAIDDGLIPGVVMMAKDKSGTYLHNLSIDTVAHVTPL